MGKRGGSTSAYAQPETSKAKRPKEGHSSQTLSPSNLNPQDDSSSSGQDYKVLNDSVHGHIELHPLCVKIIDTPQFQRLRNIKQLGGCYLVYPGASHNRFEHSIGTSYLAGKLVKKLRKRQPNLGITDEDVLCVQIAGLCHDLGHGPFSHMFDAHFIPKARPGYEWKHEDASIHMFDHMIKENDLHSSFQEENLNEQELNFIKALIKGKTVLQTDSPGTGRGQEKSFLYEIVANKRTGIDVDKFDYFARDCHGLGINNSFDHKRYMKFARVIFVDGKPKLCVRDKEVNNIYGLFQTRNSLHRRAYQHKTCNIIEIMITEAFLKADESSLMKLFQGVERKLSISESIDDMKAYTRLTDHIYYHILNFTDDALENIPEDQRGPYSLMKEARDILLRVEKRELYKCIGQTILREERDKEVLDTIPDIREEIAQCVTSGDPLEPNDFVVDIVKFSYGMDDKNPIEEVGFYEKREPDKAVTIRKEEVSDMLPKTYAEKEMRVYFKRISDTVKLRKAEECFKKWCEKQWNCTPPKAGDGLPEMTPMKSSDEDSSQETGTARRPLKFN